MVRMRSALPAFLALLPVACKADLVWQDGPGAENGPAYLTEYKEAYFRDLGNQFVGSWSREELFTHLRTTRVLFLGDHHEDFDLHRRQLKLLLELADAGMRPTLGLESVGVQDEPSIAEFMTGGTMARLRQQMRQRWPGNWLEGGQVDNFYYRDLLGEARAQRWPVFALEPTPRLPLSARDEVIAGNILRAARRHPDRLLVVVVGQAHLLGKGRLIERVGLPHVAIGAQPSPRLAQSAAPATAGAFLRSSSGVLFFEEMVISPQ